MLETGLVLLFKALIINIFVPLLAGWGCMRLCFGDRLQWIKLHIVSWFLGIGLIANWMFDLQFVRFGVGIWEYLLLLVLLAIGVLIRVHKGGLSRSSIINSLKIQKISWIKASYQSLAKWEKVVTMGWTIFVAWFLVNSFIHGINFPTYADDAFGNRHKPATNIYHDGGVKMIGQTGEALGRARLWYPIHVPIYKAVVSDFMWWWYDIYSDMFQRLGLLFILIFSYVLTFEKTKNALHSIIPAALMCGLPLVFWHAIDGYHELPSVYYSIIAIWFLYEYLETEHIDNLILGSFFLWFLSYVKNDGFVIYMPGIALGFVITILLKWQLQHIRKQVISSKKAIGLIVGGIVLFLLPFLWLKQYYDLGFNQAQWDASGVGIDSTVHREIFSQFKWLFFQENNYNIILVIVGLMLFMWYILIDRKQPKRNPIFPIVASIVIFALFTAAFLFTENYKFVMDQTTVNRTYTAAFMILCFYFWICYEAYHSVTATTPKNK